MIDRPSLLLFALASIGVVYPVPSLLQAQSQEAFAAQNHVRQITIRSHWGGLGPRADATIVITAAQNEYKRDGQSIDPASVGALVAALRSPLIPKPDPAQLGITPSWLAAHAASLEPHSNDDPGKPTPGQLALFRRSFTDLKHITRVLPELFENMHTDDYPAARVEIVFDCLAYTVLVVSLISGAGNCALPAIRAVRNSVDLRTALFRVSKSEAPGNQRYTP